MLVVYSEEACYKTMRESNSCINNIAGPGRDQGTPELCHNICHPTNGFLYRHNTTHYKPANTAIIQIKCILSKFYQPQFVLLFYFLRYVDNESKLRKASYS